MKKTMLLKATIENFMSIGDKQTIDFTITKKDKLNDASTNICGKYVNNIACIMGANGSGKSNILKALDFISTLAFKSYGFTKYENDFFKENNITKNSIDYQKFKLYENKNTKFSLEFISNDKIYNYKITLNNKEIIEESLNVKEQRQNNIFELKRNKDNSNIKTKFKLNETDKNRLLKDLKTTSALSFFINTGYLKDLENIFTYSSIFMEDIPIFFKIKNISNALYKLNEEKKFLKIFNLIKNTMENCINFGFSNLFFKDKIGESGKNEKILFFEHKSKKNNKSFILPINEESLGTQEAIFLLVKIIATIMVGGSMIIDEIENRIHPFIIEKLISLFADKTINKNNAQIIFSTHQPYLLSELTKTQIFFTEKEDLQTEIYRLDDVEGVRNDDNFYTKYLNGVYGGVPDVKNK